MRIECLYIIVSPSNKYLKVGRESVKEDSKKSLWKTIRDRYKTYYPNLTIYIFRTKDAEDKERKVFEILKTKRIGNTELFTSSLPLTIATLINICYFRNLLESIDFPKESGGNYKRVYEKVPFDIIFCEEDPDSLGNKTVNEKDFANFKSVIPGMVTNLDFYGRLNPDRALHLVKGVSPFRNYSMGKSENL